MSSYSPDNMHDRHFDFFKLLRYGILIIFFVLSVRLVLVYLSYEPPLILILGTTAALGIVLLSWWNFHLILSVFFVCIPLVSGFQIIGVMRYAPILSFTFANIYISWFAKNLLLKRKIDVPSSGISDLVDILSGIVILSLIFSLWRYPLDVVLYRFGTITFLGQHDQFWCIEASYILLQGLMFFRIIEAEICTMHIWKKSIYALHIHAAFIILFSLFQLFFRIPDFNPPYSIRLYCPFDDIHSYGSYVVFLFFVFFNFSCQKELQWRLCNIALSGIFLSLIVLSGSRITWISASIMGILFLYTRTSIKKFVFTVLGILVVFILVNLLPSAFLKSDYREFEYVRRLASVFIVKNYPDDRRIKGRLILWRRGLNMGSSYPLTGTGIGTFYRNSPHYQSLENRKRWHENAHNYYLQLTSELGVPALLLFSLILLSTFRAGFFTISRSEESTIIVRGLLFGLGAYLITMLTGHPLLLSNQQFIFWFIIAAISIPYRLSDVTPSTNRFIPYPRICLVLLAVLIFLGYTYRLLGNDREPQKSEYGIYNYEDWEGEQMRWTMKKASLQVRASSDLMGFKVYAAPHDLRKQDLQLDIFLNESLLDRIHFFESGFKSVYYYIPSIKGTVIHLKTEVNRTFNLYRNAHGTDMRDLGVALSKITFLRIMPKNGVGFYAEEKWGGNRIPAWPQDKSVKFRWTRMRASLKLGEKNQAGCTLFLMCAHPDIAEDPVAVKILADGNPLTLMKFSDNRWKKLSLDRDEQYANKVLTFQVSRTWNPRLEGSSDDDRDLGVAVVLIEKVLE